MNGHKLAFWLISIALLLSGIALVQQSRTIKTLFEYTIVIDDKVHDLKTDMVWLQMQIGTNKLLLKETQRMVVPREVALKRRIPAKR